MIKRIHLSLLHYGDVNYVNVLAFDLKLNCILICI